MLESGEVLGTLSRWGFSPPPRDKVHTFARLKLTFATDPDLKRVGLTLESLGRLRNVADYQLSLPGPFVSASIAVSVLADAEAAVVLLDALEANPAGVRRPWRRSRREGFELTIEFLTPCLAEEA